MKLVLYTVLIASSFACNENQTSQENPVSDVQVIPDRGDSSAVAVDAEENRASDVSVPDQNLPDALTIDMAVVCQPRDCGMRPDGVVDMCTNQESEIRLVGCARTPNGDCEWLTQACPPPCFGRDCPQPCEPLEDFDAGDGCNTCQCPATGERQDSVCTQFNCQEIGCRSHADCTERGFCDFPDDQCGVQGVRGVCTSRPSNCEAGGSGLCGCNGEYADNLCELWSQGVDSMPHGGCFFPNLGEAVACGPSFCISTDQYCLVPDEPGENEYSANCQSLPAGCEQGDCSCFEEKIPTHVCHNDGRIIIMIPRQQAP